MRSWSKQSQTYKIPLTTTLLGNGVNNTISKWPGSQVPLSGPIGVAINGIPMFPSLDASNMTPWKNCEVDACNAHAGQGADYHYHGDPYGPTCLYNIDGVTNNHPKIIGFSMDGFTIYGRYTNASQEGQAIDLDYCGGHTYGNYSYHYHQWVDETSLAYPQFWSGPKFCWKGDISKIPNFWDKVVCK